jgi:membrane associated rhomboid family serine protease
LPDKSLDLSERSFIGATLIVGSAVLSVIGVAAIFFKDPVIIVGIAAGAAWGLCIALLVINSWLRKRVNDLSIDLNVEKARVDQHSRTAESVSQSVLTVLRMTPNPLPPPRRQRGARATNVTTAPQQDDQQ